MIKSKSHTIPQVLIVDEDVTDRKLLTVLLEKEGYECQQAENGFEALKWLVSGHLDEASAIQVIIGDLNGLKLLTLLNEYPHLNITQFIVLTKEMSPSIWMSAKESGAHAIFTKPCNVNDLLRAIQEIMEK